MVTKKFINLKNYLNLDNIKSSLIIFYQSLLKRNTKYPTYLLNFEKQASNYFKTKYALSFSNGTTACSSLLYTLGVKKKSKVLISRLTFPSVISSILRIGATPVYLDFDKDLQLKNNLNNNQILESKFLLITHAYGIPQNIDVIKSIMTLNKNLILIEDISHAQGAMIDNKIVGTIGAGSFMSMQGDKAINAGEGGMILTNSEKIYNKLIYLSHLNRKTLTENNELNLLSKIGFLPKGRMNPLGAITAMRDIKNLDNRNFILRKKIKLIYENFKHMKNFYVPKIIDYNKTGGFHYGFPFFCNSKKSLNNLKNQFEILKYNWPFLDKNENFHDPEKFLDLIYNDDLKLDNLFTNSNDIRDQLYFFSLKEILNSSFSNIKNKIYKFKKNEN